LGNPEEGSSTGDFERRMSGALGMGLLSLMRLHGGGEVLHWEPWKICSDSLRTWASLSIGAPVVRVEPGVWKGGTYTRDFERWMKEGSLLGNSKMC